MKTEIYHAGELEAQQNAGEESIALRNGRMVSDRIIPGAVKFIENQPFFILSHRDESGNVWTHFLTGSPGYIEVSNEQAITLYPSLINSNLDEVPWNSIQLNPKVGILFIELSSRKRFRVNGTLNVDADKITLKVEQAYPNCPKYIQKRYITSINKASAKAECIVGTTLNKTLISLIAKTDTMFVGSSNNLGEMDASHRGGPPGFVQVLDTLTLKIPDYSGNGMYNTLGNFILQPQAGLLFIDFDNHSVLQLTGTAKIIWKDEEASQETGGTLRYWIFSLEKFRLLRNSENIRWDFIESSPFNPT
ncbi:putative pyridoxine 5'-phosphate oxidase superfamily flavin-nucleotide-binding protein [Algoriphagus sp. 4150]|uniref:pyridoxamine 5'-phosphate oxidase family protein n=1 Tax=Algoriphagus sp. 4150 TaxID=2817756 RepID=UPI0028565C90|nr:pyridoxamine 5'-phosphate oxidase family protein [Algoriphagus sp. 4150]MDR7130274.1 putative pyridoxine 5'-phosphate oxidase superfamily flavin-nucleotide-binding protein [Algoriphagus sp. 4150]